MLLAVRRVAHPNLGPMTTTAAPTAIPSAFAVLADIIGRVATSDDVALKVRESLDALRPALGAEETSLWVFGGAALVCVGRSGAEGTLAADVASAADGGGAGHGIRVKELTVGAQRLGMLALRRLPELSSELEQLLSTVADLLSAELAHADRLHQLKAEIERRARQIDEERLFTQKIIDSLPVGLYVIDSEYRVQAWNRNRETGIQGVSREAAIGRTIFEILHRQPAEKLRREFDEVFRTGRIQQFNIESRATGESRKYRITKIPMRLGDGQITHAISIGEDITDWTAAQDRFAQSEKLAAIGQLAAGIMHEINNPLATIAACAESLTLRLDDLRRDGCNVPTQADEFTRIIDNEVHRCKHIIDGVLDFSRPKSARKELIDVNAVIEQTLFLVKHHTRFKTVQVHTLLAPEIDRVKGTAEQLVQVLINAADAMSEQGNITIRTRRGISRAEGVVAEIIDEGHGIRSNDLPKIFEPFYTTKPPGRGTGLGLSICYTIIADHGGRIEVDSALGAGSTFRIVLPRAEVTTP
jgi:two-component system, NtrC family, sensor kinase